MFASSPRPAAALPPGQQLVAAGKWPLVGERLPRANESPWRVAISGEVKSPGDFTLAELQAMPQHEQLVDIHCVTRWSKLATRFRGVPLRVLLEQAEPTAAAKFTSFVARSDRDHSTSLPLPVALKLDVLVALEVDGEPLPAEHGGPVRLVVPNRYFYKSLKWLARIELLTADRLGYWEGTSGYHNEADPWLEQRYLSAGLNAAEARTILQFRDLQGRELLSLLAAGLDLSGMKAQDAILRNADFRRSQLSGANFDRANLTNARFAGADLRGASFRGADLEGADFSDCDLRGASLLADSIVAASFSDNEGLHGAIFDATTTCRLGLVEQLAPVQQDFVRRSQMTLLT